MKLRTLACLLLCWVSVGHAETHAVLVGIDKYDNDDITPLRYTVSDVTAFRDVLIDPEAGGVKPENVVLLTPQSEGSLRPTRTGIMVQIKKAALRTQPDDTFILYFAGHGMQTPQGQYLLGVDADPLLLSDTAVPVERLPAILKDIRARRILVIVDACRNDPAAGRAAADNDMTDAFARGLRPQILRPTVTDAPKQVATWLACNVGERAWEIVAEKHGVFSYYLLEGLKGGAAHDGQVDLAALSKYVSDKVTGWARQNGKTQTPRLDNPDNLNLVLARPKPTGPAVHEIPLATLRIDSTPPGATVQLDGEAVGQTPFEKVIPLANGQSKEVAVMLQLAGYGPVAATLRLDPNRVTTWTKALTKVELPTSPTTKGQLPTPVKPVNNPTPPAQTGQAPWPANWKAGPDGLPMVEVPAGSFLMGSPGGSSDPAEGPRHEVALESYKIQAVPVTNEAYIVFLNRLLELGYVEVDGEGNAITKRVAGHPEYQPGFAFVYSSQRKCGIMYDRTQKKFVVKAGRQGYPITYVTWMGALYYAMAYNLQLPTEAQFERAAIGTDASWRYPWGPQLVDGYANLGSDGPRSVFASYRNRSAVGAADMVGNVWEWTMDSYAADYHKRNLSYEPRITPGATDRMLTLRGAGYTYPADMASIYTRRGADLFVNEPDVGFRCVLNQPGNQTPVVTQTSQTQTASQTQTPSSGRPNTVPVNKNTTPPKPKRSDVTLVRHPTQGLSLAIPKGYDYKVTDNNVFLVYPHGDPDEVDLLMMYFPIGPVYNDPASIKKVLQYELSNIGFKLEKTLQDQQLPGSNPAFEIHRLVMQGTFEEDTVVVCMDVVKHAAKWHGFVLGCKQDKAAQADQDYQTFLSASDFDD